MHAHYGYPERTDIDPIPNYGKEGKAIKRMLDRGFEPPDILAAWMEKIRKAGVFKTMVYVNEDIGTVPKISHRTSDNGNRPYFRTMLYRSFLSLYGRDPTGGETSRLNDWIDGMIAKESSYDEILAGPREWALTNPS